MNWTKQNHHTNKERRTAKKEVALKFQRPASTKFWRIERKRYLNDTPIAAEEMWIRAAHCRSLTPEELDEMGVRRIKG